MKSFKQCAAAVLVAGALAFGSGSIVLAQDAAPKTAQPRSGDPYVPLPPHAQPRAANAPDNGMAPSAKEKAVDRKINNICRGC